MSEGLTLTQIRIQEECDSIKDMLIEKNRAYGNSALDPVRIFSKADKEQQLLARIDDKLSRVQLGYDGFNDEDCVGDLIGYLILLRVLRKNSANGETIPT